MSKEPFSTLHLDYLQRTTMDLAGLSAKMPSTSAPPDLRRMWRVRGVGRIDKNFREPPNVSHQPQSLLPSNDAFIGLYGHKIPLAFLVWGERGQVEIHLGTWSQANRERISAEALDQRLDILGAVLNSLYPAIDLAPPERVLNRLPHSGLVLGNPTLKPADPLDGALSIDRLIRAMSGTDKASAEHCTWAGLILAEPVGEITIAELRNRTIKEIRYVQAAAQAERAPSPLAKSYVRLLTSALKTFTSGLEVGLWRTGVYLLGNTEGYYRLAAVWRAIFSGDKSLPEPVRVLYSAEASTAVGELAANWALPDAPGAPGPGDYQHPALYQTLLTSSQVAAYVHLPQLETSGFEIRTVPDFDTVPPLVVSARKKNVISLGYVIERSRPTETDYEIALDDLTRHTFVAGVTGAGKTNTLFHILKQAAKANKHFLVLEPAKAEYRALMDDESLGDRLQVFTLGNEQTAPFRLNPFEVVEWDATPVGVHIDLLRSVFTASFGMWTPLPQILERCLHAIYQDRGWNTTADKNHRLDGKSEIADTFPTLSELYDKADKIIQTLGYEGKVVDDMRAALLTRINGLRAGGKGSMLDVQRSLPMKSLLEHPTVLELQGMGDDDDKAFVMGLLLIRLYEYRRAEYRRAGNEVDGLQHLLVIEEAHRLLTNVGMRSEEEANPKAKAVESFANLLSEIRAYGQGVIVVDQVPVKLAPEVIKNTNLKIAHRVVASDDREALAGSMAMNKRQADTLATLKRGQAAIFSVGDYTGDDAPVLIEVPPAKGSNGESTPSDEYVKERMCSSPTFKANCVFFQPLLHDVDMSQPANYRAREAARALADDPTLRRDFVRLAVSVTEDDGALDRLWNDLVVRVQVDRHGDMDETVMLRILVVDASAWFAQRRGSQKGWSYADTAELQEKLRGVLLAKLAGRETLQAVQSFRAVMHRLHARPFEPFPGCAKICTQSPPVCLYRGGVADVIEGEKQKLQGAWNTAYANDKKAGQRLMQTWAVSERASYELIERHAVQQDAIVRIRLCYAQHMMSGQFLEDHQVILKGLLDESTRPIDGGRNNG